MESSEGLGASGRPAGAWSQGQHCGHRTKGAVHYSILRENIEGSRAENHKAFRRGVRIAQRDREREEREKRRQPLSKERGLPKMHWPRHYTVMGLGSAPRAMPLRNQLTLKRCSQDHGLEEAPPSSMGSDISEPQPAGTPLSSQMVM